MNNVLLSIAPTAGNYAPFIFYATAPSFTMRRNTLEPRWSEQERVAALPAGQFLGPANATLDLNGIFYPDSFIEQAGGVSSRGMMANMSAVANAGITCNIIGMMPSDMSGIPYGLWYIRSIQDERTWWDPGAGAKRIDFQITLRGYGEDANTNLITLFS